MAAPTTGKAPPPRKRPARSPLARAESSSRPFLRFHLSEALRRKTLTVLVAIETDRDAAAHRGALADLVVALTNSGMDGYFIQPLKAAKAGFVIQQSASLGLAGAMQVMGAVIRSVIGRMDSPQVLSVSCSMRRLMR